MIGWKKINCINERQDLEWQLHKERNIASQHFSVLAFKETYVIVLKRDEKGLNLIVYR